MSKKNKKIVLILITLLVISGLFFNPNIKKVIRNNIPADIYQRISFTKKLILNQDFGFYRYEEVVESNFSKIKNFIYDENFSFKVNRKYKRVDDNKSFQIYQLPPLFPAVRSNHVNSSYMDFHDNNIIYASKNGVFFKVVINLDNLEFFPVKSNLNDFFTTTLRPRNASINYYNANTISKFGVKDIHIDDDIIYLSYIEEFDKYGYNTSILKAKMNDSLVFEKLFSSKKYISSDYKEFYPIQSGGRIVKFVEDSLLFSVGDYRDRLKAQDMTSDNGKILSVNRFNGGSRIISLGHRNPQGLDYNFEYDRIVSTEHGPNGGDEVNFNIESKTLKNFGWPISNYGYHYGEENAINDSHYADNTRVIEGSPLYKSHAEYGFIEPIKYWNKNPAVSEVKFINNDKNFSEFVVSTLGYDTIDRPDAQHLIHYKYDIKLDSLEIINKYYVGERIRDLIFDEKNHMLFFTGETNGVIGSIGVK
ncbi:MAG: hypothetical protein HON34_10595 [Pelagibacteraceae bacterium]|nr:hypothetical protein [Pelagibacteraceae bacterium]MBT6170907.1 hypothetical protein [Flavobacteriaceae bacterium]MBT6448080.1 hypothetical protein [Flavobacteriaceae bacterium]